MQKARDQLHCCLLDAGEVYLFRKPKTNFISLKHLKLVIAVICTMTVTHRLV